ncbi:hypothetical protein OG407_20945 [Streptomyces sp. NBC_01515]|uniref:hypothetical protein n=1 Tax=Streptomyces sp. NBC_01515 TaxID=2903890 RepID=UPI003869BE26
MSTTTTILNDVFNALREKPGGMTRDEVQERFPTLASEVLDSVLWFLYGRDQIRFDPVTNPDQPRWIA